MRAMPNGRHAEDVPRHGVVPVVPGRNAQPVAAVQVTVAAQAEQVAVSAHPQAHLAAERQREPLAHVHARVAAARAGVNRYSGGYRDGRRPRVVLQEAVKRFEHRRFVRISFLIK